MPVGARFLHSAVLRTAPVEMTGWGGAGGRFVGPVQPVPHPDQAPQGPYRRTHLNRVGASNQNGRALDCALRSAARRARDAAGRSARNRPLDLPARLPERLRPGRGAAGRPHHRPGARREEQPLYRRGGLRQGRPLRRAGAPPGPADPPAAPHRGQGRGDRGVRRDRLGRGAGRGRGPAEGGCPGMGQRSGLALFLRRHDGAGAARRHRPAAPCHALCAPALHLLRGAGRCGLARRGRRQVRHRFAGDAGRRSRRGMGAATR